MRILSKRRQTPSVSDTRCPAEKESSLAGGGGEDESAG
jgi:hypothetical protein